MLLGSALIKAVAIILFIGLGLLGALLFAGFRRGWMRNGYFTIPALILMVVGFFIAFQGLGNGITLALLGKDFASNPILVLGINGLAELVVMLGGAILISRAAGQNLFAVFRLEGFHETPGIAYILAAPTIIAAQFVGNGVITIWMRLLKYFPALYSVLEKYETESDKAVEGLVTPHGPTEFVLILIFVAIVPAFAEETLFRGFTQSNIERSGYRHARTWTALIVASFLFALVHGSLFKLPGLLALGLILGWMAHRTNNLFVGSLGHAVNNGLIVILLYLKPDLTEGSSLVGASDIPLKDAFVSLIGSVPMLGLLVYFFNRVTEPIEARHNPERELAWLNSYETDDETHSDT
jgi:membrane protease YdiL (CAAX protease family)